MNSLHPYPYLPSGWRSHRDGPFTPPAPKRGGVGEAIAAIVSYIVAYSSVIEAVIAIASIAYSLKQANDQRKDALTDQFNSVQRNARRNFRQPLSPRRLIFGRTRVGGPLIFAHNRTGFETHLLIALAGHELQQIESVWMFDEVLPYVSTPGETFGRVIGKYSRHIILFTFKGTPTQDIGALMRTALDPRDTPNLGDSIAISDVIETTDKFHGIAAIYAVTKAFSVSWEGQSPEFSAIVKGALLYDPRDLSLTWSRNVALQARHYLVNYLNVDPLHINAGALEASADICDEEVARNDDDPEPRYCGDGVFTADQSHTEILRTLEQAMAGRIRNVSGIWYIEAGAPKEADEDTPHFYESDLKAAYEVTFDRPDRSFPNAVRGNFFDSVDWQPASFPQYEDAAAIAAEGAITWLEIDLPLTVSHTTAQRIARIALRKARSRRAISITLDLRGLLARPGSLVKFTSLEVGFDATVFEVEDFAFVRDGNKFLTRLDLIEYDAAAYDWDETTDEAPMNRGNGTLDSIRSRGVVEPTYTNSTPPDIGDIVANHRVDAGYTINWGNPNTSLSELKRVEIEMRTFAETTDGSDFYITESVTLYDASITNGDESKLFASTRVVFPAGHILVSYGISSTSTIQAFFMNNVEGPLQQIDPAP